MPALDELLDVRTADVYKSGQLAAHMTRRPDGAIEFRYTDDWVSSDGLPVATTLPVSAEAVLTPAGGVPPFFAGLLPEGRRLGALRRSLKTSTDDDLTLVMGVGGDTVGDVRVVPEGTAPDSVPPRLRVDSFADVRFADLLAEMDVRVDRVALPGVQDKVSAVMLNLPVKAAGAHTLLKLNPRELKHLVENEYFFLRAAHAAKVSTVKAHLVHDRNGESGLAVERFDRIERHEDTISLAVEDGCQVLGIYPASKYSVTSEDLFGRLSAACEAPRPAAADFFRQITFAYLTGNGDAHAKNFSILRDPSGRWAPTPAYDVPTTQPYGDPTMALSIGGRRDGITGAGFLALAEAIGLPRRAARTIVLQVTQSAEKWTSHLEDIPLDPGKIKKLRRFVANRRNLLLTNL